MKETNASPILDQFDVIVEKGDRVPFDGVLVPEKNYRLYQNYVEFSHEIEKAEFHNEERAEAFRSYSEGFWVGLGVGVLVGFGGAMFLSR